MALRGANGTCITPTFVTPPPGEFWSEWPPAAAAIVANAGRRSGALPDPVPLPLSPPAAPLPNGGDVCVRLAVLPCDPTNDAQRWFVSVDAEGAPVRTRSITFFRSVKTSRISTQKESKLLDSFQVLGRFAARCHAYMFPHTCLHRKSVFVF
jgi:hypothetical protein